MTESTEPDIESVDPEAPKSIPCPTGDLVLRTLATVADDDEKNEFSLTLAVNGVLVAGQLIGRKRWFREVVEDDAFAAITGVTKALNKMVLEDDEKFGQRNIDDYHYVHLSNARYIDPSGLIPTEQGMYWRGRISEISGWSWGSMAPPTASS